MVPSANLTQAEHCVLVDGYVRGGGPVPDEARGDCDTVLGQQTRYL